MEKDNFRYYTISAKVSASQKNLYIKLAKKSGLSLSEWIGSRIDMSIENENLAKTKSSERRIERLKNEYNNYNHLPVNEELITYKVGGIINNSTLKKQMTPDKNNFTQQKTSQQKINNSKPIAS